MAEEPQPQNPPPNITEDAKAAAALESLDSSARESSTTTNADAAALNDAVSNLSVSASSPSKSAATGASGAGGKAGTEEPKKKVKIDAADVAFLVEELEVSKVKATEMLRDCGGDRSLAVRGFVLPASSSTSGTSTRTTVAA